MMATGVSWHPLLPSRVIYRRQAPFRLQAFRRSDMDRFAKDAWRSANEGFEQLVFEAKKTAERIDRRYSVTRRLTAVAQSAAERAREVDREFEIGLRWRTFSMDFVRNWPRYRKQLSDFLNTPIGSTFATIFFLWFALSGWLFRVLIFSAWILPFAGPLLIGTLANNLVIKGACPACKRQFAGYKNQIIRCGGCGNIVWQPKGDFTSRGGGVGDFFSGGRGGKNSSKSSPEIIDVDFEEK